MRCSHARPLRFGTYPEPHGRVSNGFGRHRHRTIASMAAGITAFLMLAATIRAGESISHPELTFHAAPKPLASDAVTEDWPGFLGPRRDATSRETRLAKSFPPGGPNLVWEMTRGSGYAAPAVTGDRIVFFHRLKDDATAQEALQFTFSNLTSLSVH